MFIDDIDFTKGKLYPTIVETDKIIEDMQKVIDTWESYLKTIGEAIYLDKLFAYAI